MDFKKITYNHQQFNIGFNDEASVSVINEIFLLNEYRVAYDCIVKAKNIIYDVGAHIGVFSIYCRSINKTVKLVALEPETDNYKILQQNIINNQIKDIRLLDLALGVHTGKSKLYLSKDSHNHSLTKKDKQITGASTIIVKTVSWTDLYNLTADYQLVDLIKMDIEGAENEIIPNIDENSLCKIKNFIIEYHNFDKDQNKLIEQYLREYGYGVRSFPSKFDKTMGFIFANNKR